MKGLNFFVFIFCFLLLANHRLLSQQSQILPYQNPQLSIEARIDDLLQRMTLEEKAAMVGGTGFESRPLERLGIPSLRMTDGPVGVRSGNATAFLMSVAMAATWDTELIKQVGQALVQ